ncbi:MAG: hypothetical protein GY898_26880 [Proteobacteria bacterium]|nr:hypothetical protein [Pseudomonadota bacterium]
MRSFEVDLVPTLGGVPEHERGVGLTLLELQPTVSFGLGKGFKVGVDVPFAFKDKLFSYSIGGQDYEPPDAVGRLTNFGLGDIRVRGGLTGKPPGTKLILNASVGVSLPTGKSADEPRGLMFGGGTVDPLVSLNLLLRTRPFGLLVGGNARLPLYDNSKGYRGSITIEGTVGTTFSPPRPADKLELLLLVHAVHVEPERWLGSPWLNSGRDVIAMTLGGLLIVAPGLSVNAQLRTNVFEVARGEQFTQPVTLSVGVSGTIDLRKKKDEHGHGDEDDH